jgi:hypothetical protein
MSEEAKPLTREEVEAMSHADLAKVKTKRRIAASLPSAAEEGEPEELAAEEEPITPTARMTRSIEETERKRQEREANSARGC